MTESIDTIRRRVNEAELSQLWHLSRTATAGASGRWARLVWASQQYAAVHPDVSTTAAYKVLERMLAEGGR